MLKHISNKMSAMIAIPHTGIVRTELAVRLLTFQPYVELFFSYRIPHDSNRNAIVKQFLKTNHDWLIMVDSDVVPPTNLLSILETDKKIIGCLVSGYQTGKIKTMAFDRGKNGLYENISPDFEGEREVEAVGTGCIVMHRSVLETLKPPYFKFRYNHEGIMNWGEDFYFCEIAKEAGFKVYANGSFQAIHIVSTPI